MDNTTTIVSFYSDKGGVGSTMLTVSTAAYLAYQKGKKVCVIDAVAGYRSLEFDRSTEVDELLEGKRENSTISPEQLENLSKEKLLGSPVHIYRITDFQEFRSFIEKEKHNYDYIFIDVAGVSFENFQFIMKSHFIFLVSSMDNAEKDNKTYEAFKRAKKNTKNGSEQKFNLKGIKIILNRIPYSDPDFDEKKLFEYLESDKVDFLRKTLYERSLFTEYSTITGMQNLNDEFTLFAEELVSGMEQSLQAI